MSSEPEQTTHFGYQEVPKAEKAERVGAVFSSVAKQYDIMNDLMSVGLHRLWKDIAIRQLHPLPGQRILDLAGGTGDLSARIHRCTKGKSEIILGDINHDMLQAGRDRLLDAGLANAITLMQMNAEHLPFDTNHFDRIIIGFGLRNVTDKSAALRSMYRCLKPGGKCLILEFSTPLSKPLNTLYDVYSFQVLPKLGQWVANDADSYQYLAESIRMHPDQHTLKAMMEDADFEDCKVTNLAGGIVAIHTGYKF